MRKSLKRTILCCAVLPVLILGGIIVLLSATSVKSAIISQVEDGLRGTAATTLAAYDQNSGSYLKNSTGDVWKGGYNISQSGDLVDSIRDKSGMEVTFFYGSERVMSSLKDENGERLLGSPAGQGIMSHVIDNGEEYFSDNVCVNGEYYYGYYVPVYQPNQTENPVGMVFAGVNKKETLSSVMRVILFVIFVVIMVVVGSVIIAFMLTRSITNAINRGVECVTEVSSGNLNVHIDSKYLKRPDEIGNLVRAIDTLKNDLRGIIGGISESTNMLLNASDSLQQTSHQTYSNMDEVKSAVSTITDGATSQAEDTQTASDNIMYMGDLITETGRQAAELGESADNMMAASDKTNATIAELKGISQEVQRVVSLISEKTQQTNESAKNIHEASSFISGIADETNLLSLNASIEAARAGEAGKGFAVVASEIQKLAEQSNEASGNIDQIVNELIDNFGQVVDEMKHMQDVIESQNLHIVSTEQSIGEVVEEINSSIANIRSIENKARELEKARAEVVEKIEGLSDIAQSNVASTQQTSSVITEVSERFKNVEESAENLRGTADRLADNIRNFKLS